MSPPPVELGARRLGQLDDLLTIVGIPLVSSPDWLRDAAEMATEHQLTFYDAAWAGPPEGSAWSLSAQTANSAARLAESATATALRIGVDIVDDPPTDHR